MGEPLIVGIDPGTTTAVAVLDIHGNLVKLASKKDFSVGEINRLLLKFGNPIIISSDISSPTKKIEKIAASFSSKLILPKTDMRRKEKYKIVAEFLPLNSHKKDALAAALFAWGRIRPLVEKVDKKVERLNIPLSEERELTNFVVENIIMRRVNIVESIKMFFNS